MTTSDCRRESSLPFDARVEQETQPVVVEVAEGMTDLAELLTHEAHRFGGAVRDRGYVVC